MNTWSPIWSGIVDSTLWAEEGDVIKVFMTMLATKDSDHICRLDAYRIGNKCHIDELRVLDILKLLASPDTRRKSAQKHDGRRIQVVEDGWLVLNGEYYRKMVQDEARKARWRKAQAAMRERRKGTPTPGETSYVNNFEAHGPEEADRQQDISDRLKGGEI